MQGTRQVGLEHDQVVQFVRRAHGGGRHSVSLLQGAASHDSGGTRGAEAGVSTAEASAGIFDGCRGSEAVAASEASAGSAAETAARPGRAGGSRPYRAGGGRRVL